MTLNIQQYFPITNHTYSWTIWTILILAFHFDTHFDSPIFKTLMDEQMSDNNNAWFVLFFGYVLCKIIHFGILFDLSLLHDCAKLLLFTHGSTQKSTSNHLDRVTLLCDLTRSISLNGLSSSHQTKLFRSSAASDHPHFFLWPSFQYNILRSKGFPFVMSAHRKTFLSEFWFFFDFRKSPHFVSLVLSRRFHC